MKPFKSWQPQRARVIRDEKETIIPASEVVPSDILALEEGDHVPANARLIEVVELKANEAVLTGESTPVEKALVVLKEDTPVSERRNMVFSATHIFYGRLLIERPPGQPLCSFIRIVCCLELSLRKARRLKDG